ncbi:MAG: transcription termination/antitermination protein NusA [Nitrospinae bacterium]|nr:transcription termination/antitermination protein NusA [Nitrospinota bacterium]MBF0633484.1 transcription termination/antitermination protein NusA [Nitrospinota bacterium]
MTSELINALKMVADEKSMDINVLISTIEEAVLAVASKRFNRDNLQVVFNTAKGEFELYEELEVVDDVEYPLDQIALDKAISLDTSAVIGSTVKSRVIMEDLGRIAAQSVRQMIHKKGREAEVHKRFLNYKARIGEMITVKIAKRNDAGVVFELGEIEAIMPPSEQLATDKYERGRNMRVVIAEVSEGRREPRVTLSRANPALLQKLLEMESPELADGSVEIISMARDQSGRSKVAVRSRKKDIDPVGSLIGAQGVRIKPVMKELSGEKIDIFTWSDDPKKLIASALTPAKGLTVIVSEKRKFAEVIAPEDQLSLAIGKRGCNVKLAVQITHWDLDVMSRKEYEDKLARMSGQERRERDGAGGEPLSGEVRENRSAG